MSNRIKRWIRIDWPSHQRVKVPHVAYAVAKHRGDDSEKAVKAVLLEMQIAAVAGALVVRNPLTWGENNYPVGASLRNSFMFRRDAVAWLKMLGVGIRRTPKRKALVTHPQTRTIRAQSEPASAV